MPDDESTPVSRAENERGSGAMYRRPTNRTTADADDDHDLDNRFAALDEEEGDEKQFRRAPKRVQVRRGAVTKKVAARLKVVIIVLIVLGLFGTVTAYLYSYGKHSWRFRVESSDNIEITGNKHVSRSQVMQVMGGDIGRNIFFVPLEGRQKQLEQISWVKSASVMRFLPNRLRVDIVERTPIAYVQFGQRVELIDGAGVLMEIPVGSVGSWSFPVLVGMRESDTPAARASRMKIYQQLVSDLDSEGERYSQDLNEVDLSDPEDAKISVADNDRSIIVHLGDSNFLERYKLFKAHIREWRQQYANLESVDLRYGQQVILTPDSRVANEPPKTVAITPRASARRKHRTNR